MTVLVTGGTGYIGSHMVLELWDASLGSVLQSGAHGRRRFVLLLSFALAAAPGPPPFASMNLSPADSGARRTAKSLALVTARCGAKQAQRSACFPLERGRCLGRST